MKFKASAFSRLILRFCFGWIAFMGIVSFYGPVATAAGKPNVLFILDSSASMWAKLDDARKIDIAKDRMTELVRNLDNVDMGLIVYGHRRKADCSDIELMTPVGNDNRETIIRQIRSIKPKGKTPITKSIELAVQQLETIEDETGIVLVSDGLESCEGNPCELVERLKARGIKFTLDVVGFDIRETERQELECIAQAGGGRYFTAQTAIELKKAFTEVKKEVDQRVVIAKKRIVPKTKVTKQSPPAKEQGQEKATVERETTGQEVTAAEKKSVKNVTAVQQEIAPKTSQKTGTPIHRTPEVTTTVVDKQIEVREKSVKPKVVTQPGLRLRAVLREGADPLAKPVAWNVYGVAKDINGNRTHIAYKNEPAALFTLPTGRYFITAEYGRANSSEEIQVNGDEFKEVTFNLSGGYLKLHGTLKEDGKPLEEHVNWNVYGLEKDPLDGKRRHLGYIRGDSALFILPAGRYFVTAEYGAANTSREITVVAGELTESTLNLSAGYLRLYGKLKEDGELLREHVNWNVYGQEQDPLDGKRRHFGYIRGDSALFTLPAGRYFVTAEYGAANTSREISVEAGEIAESTINLSAGYLRLRGKLKEDAEPLSEHVNWNVYGLKQDPLDGNRRHFGYIRGDSALFTLPAGRYFVTAEYGAANASREISVEAGEIAESTINLSAGYLRLHGKLKEDAEPLGEKADWHVYGVKKDPLNGQRRHFASSRAVSPLYILPAGRYFVTAVYRREAAKLSAEVEVTAGKVNDVTINLAQK